MIKKGQSIILTVILALPFFLLQAASAGPQAQEGLKSRPEKQEVIDQMVKVGKISAQEQNQKLDAIVKGLSATQTPRSDFMFCTGLAYLGNYAAQKCVAQAYEKGIGIVEDPMEAFVWYSIAQQNNPAEPLPQVETLKISLVANYPAPSEEELDEMVKTQKERIAEYQAETKQSKQ